MRRRFLIAMLLLAASCPCVIARADTGVQAGITFFRADVTVRENATLEVREEIDVRNASSYYKHGFQRDLPISLTDRWDSRYVGTYQKDNGIRVKILEVTEDGERVNYEQGKRYGLAQLFIGPRNVALDSGAHRFVIRYTVDWALISRAGRDTLYWNAVGTERTVPIAEAILAVHLPAAVPSENIEIETSVGGLGLSFPRRPENTLERVTDASGAIVYRAMNMNPRQSVSLAITWPSGYIHMPKFVFLRREGGVLIAPLLLFFYYLIAWMWIGPDHKPSAFVARYEPPEGISPAAARYIATGTTDGRSFAAVIAQLAVHGCIRVESENGKYRLSRLTSDRAAEACLAPEEKFILALLFEDGTEIVLSGAMDERNAAQNGRYVSHIHDELANQLGNKYFTRHTEIIALGVLVTFVSALGLAITARGRDTSAAVFTTLWVLFIGLMLGMMIELSLASNWKTARRAGTGWIKLLPGAAALSIFGGATALLLKNLASGVSLSFSLMLVAFLAINLGWGPQLKRKSPFGRQVSDQIAGFRQFLQKVDQDKLDRLNPASNAPQDLDRFLAYAIALEVNEAWGDHLSQAFLTATVYVES